MITLIIGHPGSGKSALAEQMVTELSEPGGRIYLATMIPYGEEGARRIEKHRKMREGKGFETVEAPFDAAAAFDRFIESRAAFEALSDPGSITLLLECLSNLVANEMFERHTDAESLTKKIEDDILSLSAKVKNLIIVSNRFEITEDFNEETADYARTMDKVNSTVSRIADRTVRIRDLLAESSG